MSRACGVTLLTAVAWAAALSPGARETEGAGLRFEVTVAKGLLAAPRDGRLLVVLGRRGASEPRTTLGTTGMDAPPVLGRDVDGFAPGAVAVLDAGSALFPI